MMTQSSIASQSPSTFGAMLGVAILTMEPTQAVLPTLFPAPSPPVPPGSPPVTFFGASTFRPSIISSHLIHGLLMVVAWGLLAPFGALLPRMKTALPNGVWFKWHQRVQVLAVTLATIGSIIAIVNVPAGYHFNSTHNVVGVVITILALVQSTVAWMRPHKPKADESPTMQRMAWRLSHLVVGCTLLGLAVWQVFTGVKLTYGLDYLVVLFFVFVGVALMLGLIVMVVPNTKSANTRSSPGSNGTFGTGVEGAHVQSGVLVAARA